MHNKMDFADIASVSLVDKNDEEYRAWLDTLISNQKKKSQNNTKRLFIIEKCPEIFNYIRDKWNSGEYEEVESKKDLCLCMNCRQCSPDKYRSGSFVCWQGYISSKPKTTYLTSSCTKIDFRYFQDKINFVWKKLETRFDVVELDKKGICAGNFKFFLKELGLIEKVKLGWTIGKENEKEFFKTIKNIDSSIQFLPTVFKIKYNSGKGLKFNILDGLLLLPLGEMCIIEFKSKFYYQDDIQDHDYLMLFEMSKYPISQQGCYYISIFKDKDNEDTRKINDLYLIPYINQISDRIFFDIIKYQSDIIFAGTNKRRSLFEFC